METGSKFSLPDICEGRYCSWRESAQPRSNMCWLCAEWWEFPQTNASLPFGTVVQQNVLANLHDHLSGEQQLPRCKCVSTQVQH
jgi:hypothetical protein